MSNISVQHWYIDRSIYPDLLQPQFGLLLLQFGHWKMSSVWVTFDLCSKTSPDPQHHRVDDHQSSSNSGQTNTQGQQFFNWDYKCEWVLWLVVTWNGDDRDRLIGYNSGWSAVFHIEMGRLETAPGRKREWSYFNKSVISLLWLIHTVTVL